MQWNMYGETYTINKKSIWDQTSWIDVMIRAYLECALWSSIDDNDEPFDTEHDIDDFSDEAIKQAFEDCQEFANDFHDAILCLHQQCKYDQSRAGHDLWLTRNGHGVGFWDRGLHETGEKMTEKAQNMGSCDLYKGDDNKLYFAG